MLHQEASPKQGLWHHSQPHTLASQFLR